MTKAIAVTDSAAVLERVLAVGDLEQLTPADRVMYYRSVCESLGLNPLTRPFEYLKLSGKLILYARKDATEQLRHKRAISITRLEHEVAEGVYIVTAYAKDDDDRQDSDVGVVPIDNLRGEARANAIMKATTKAKRRVTLSICGLGMLDESELDGVPLAKHVRVDTETGEILEGDAPPVRDAGRGKSDLPEPSTAVPLKQKKVVLDEVGQIRPVEPGDPPLHFPDEDPPEESAASWKEVLLKEIKALGDNLELKPPERMVWWAKHVGGGVLVANAPLDKLHGLHDALLAAWEAKERP